MNVDVPILQSMLQKLLDKGHKITIVDTHPSWCGVITACMESKSSAGGIGLLIIKNDGKKGKLTVHQPERWKLGKNDAGEWTLWPPRAETRK